MGYRKCGPSILRTLTDAESLTRKQNSLASIDHVGGAVRMSVRRYAGWNWRPKLLQFTSPPAEADPKHPTSVRMMPFMRRAAMSFETAKVPFFASGMLSIGEHFRFVHILGKDAPRGSPGTWRGAAAEASWNRGM